MTEPRSRKEMNVKVVRLTTTEDVVADLLEETDDSVTIRGGIVAVPTKDGNIGFASVSYTHLTLPTICSV